MNPEINGEARIQKVRACAFHRQYLMRKKRWKKNERIIIGWNIYKGALLAARDQWMKTKYPTRKRLWERMKIIHCTDCAPATLTMRKCIDMPQEKGTITMSDQFHFDFARREWLDAKPFEHDG